MNGDKPLNIPADEELKPDIEVTTGSFSTEENNTVKLSSGSTPSTKIPNTNFQTVKLSSGSTPSTKIPNTNLQDELSGTLKKIIPEQKKQEQVKTNPETSTAEIPKPPISPQVVSSPDGKKVFSQKPLRTYEGDLAELMSKNKTSVATIAIAESKKNEGEEKISTEVRKNHTKQILLGFLSFALIAGGIVGGYYLYQKSSLAVPTPVQKTLPIFSIVRADRQIVLTIAGEKELELATKINETFSSIVGANGENNQKIVEIILGEKKGEELNRISGSDFIKKASLKMPDALSRSLIDQWMIGTFIENDDNKIPFIIFKTDFFQNAFSGMLSWEASMPDDLADFLNFKDKARASENTASTSIASYFSIRGKFVDKQIKNRDVREFINNQGEILFLYSFIDKDTIVFTTSEQALINIIGRIEKQTYVR